MINIAKSFHVQTLQINGATYEQRYNQCGRDQCWCQKPPEERSSKPPGHGPYWYRTWTKGKKTRSRYIGRELVTDRADRADS